MCVTCVMSWFCIRKDKVRRSKEEVVFVFGGGRAIAQVYFVTHLLPDR